MKTLTFISIFLILLANISEARVGGGRSSMGSRGSRSVSPRSTGSPMGGYQQRPTQQPYNNPNVNAPRPGLMGGSFMTGLMGGVAGSFLGSMLFRGNNNAYGASGGGGGMGLFDLLLIAIAGYFIFRWWKRSQVNARPQSSVAQENFSSQSSQPYQSNGASFSDESQISDLIYRYDSKQDLDSFKDKRMDDFYKIQAAFMNRDLSQIRSQMTDDLYSTVNTDLEKLKTERKINKLENISIRSAKVVEAWEEPNRIYTTIQYNANLLDYVVDESTQNVVSGSKTEPVKFEEYWTYVADLNSSGNLNWKLSAIEGTA